MLNRGRRTWMVGIGRFDFHINKTLVSVIYQRGREKPIKEAYERYGAGHLVLATFGQAPFGREKKLSPENLTFSLFSDYFLISSSSGVLSS